MNNYNDRDYFDSKFKSIEDKFDDLIKKINQIDAETVKRNEFKSEITPIKTIVYGIVGLILSGIFTAILSGVIRAKVL